MNKNNRFFLAIIFFFIGFSAFLSCLDKETAQPEKVDYSCFPLDSGHFVIYQVDTIVYDAFKKDTTKGSYQIKDLIVGSTTDNSNRVVKQIIRYRRATDSASWRIEETYTAHLTTSTAEVVFDNQRFIKLVFPIATGKTWNSNAYNTNDNWPSSYSNINESASILGKTYPGTVSVLHDDKTLIKKTHSLEKYSPNIGLVYKEFVNDSSSSDTLNTPLETRITGGIEMRYYIKSYGK